MALTITALPSAPNKLSDSPYEFSLKADAWVAAMSTFTTEANALAAEAENNAEAAEAKALEASGYADVAAASAATAVAAPGTSANSSSSHSVSVTSKTFDIATSTKAFVVGMKVLVVRTSAPTTTYMYGTVTAYAGNNLTVNVEAIKGSGGPYIDWTISLTGPGSVIDATPVNGNLGAAISSDWAYDHNSAAAPHSGWVDDVPVNGATTAPISSNWAYDHAGSATSTNIHLGVGQTWTNVTTSRSAGGTFTNNTGKPIEVAVTFYHETLPGLIYYQSGAAIGSLWTVGCTACASAGAGYGYYGTATWVVPPGHVYRSICNGGPTLLTWFELR